MERVQASADILAAIKACFDAEVGDRCREYQWGRTRGLPPAECNSITWSWMDRGQSSFSDCQGGEPCEQWTATFGARIVLTRVCLAPDQANIEKFFELEERESICFDSDLDVLENCINCMDWTTVMVENKILRPLYVGTSYDVESEGGGFSAYIELTIVAGECCASPAG